MTLEKVGARTGWTYGQVTNTCEDVISPVSADWTLSDRRKIYCSTKLDAYVGQGDSGSPVFYIGDYRNQFATFYGIVWGKTSGSACADQSVVYCDDLFFSSYAQIVEDLGTGFDLISPLWRANYGGGPAPAYYTNLVTGPREMQPGNSCTWSVVTDVPNASIQWSVLGQVLGSGSTFQTSAPDSFWLDVTAWNENGDGVTSSIWIDVSSDHERCYVE
jgi:hypothetical protein